VTADEFVLIMAILGQCKISETVTGQQQLVDLVAEQCHLLQEFNAADQEHLDRVIICIKHALPYFSVSYIYNVVDEFVFYILFVYLRLRSSLQLLFSTFVTKSYPNVSKSVTLGKMNRNWTFSNY